ncbi:MAG TPA: choice-of-anchor tandem repeat GloVer-containing protein [Verrucomicrobiae bacterium]|nr:choice-of-anchor tandem repeat GloVer-containing protein [Verrucomicrobiae bacterium]
MKDLIKLSLPKLHPFILTFLLLGLSVPGLWAQAQPTQFVVLHSFTNAPDGEHPCLSLSAGKANNTLFGTTLYGGSNGQGIIFKMNADGSGYTILHNFTAGEAQNFGLTPPNTFSPPVIQANDGALYGVATGGSNYQHGMAFKLKTDGSGFTVIHNFGAGDIYPITLIQGDDGELYGAGAQGVFKMDTSGSNYSVLHTFNIATDGDNCFGLIQGSDGALYGTCQEGGASSTNSGNLISGTIFKINTNGTGFTVLHNFGVPSTDAQYPCSGVIEGSDGALYGVTPRGGGGVPGAGTVYKINKNGLGYTLLHAFQGSPDGSLPYGALVQGLNNMLYGTTQLGGSNSLGTVFEISLDGSTYNILYQFASGTDGYYPYAGLVQGPSSSGSGVLYGATYSGTLPSNTYGTLFALEVNPPMSITPVVNQFGSNTVVFWPAWALNYTLQTSTNINGPWTAATNGVPMTGFQPTNTTGNAFYRLVFPQSN